MKKNATRKSPVFILFQNFSYFRLLHHVRCVYTQSGEKDIENSPFMFLLMLNVFVVAFFLYPLAFSYSVFVCSFSQETFPSHPKNFGLFFFIELKFEKITPCIFSESASNRLYSFKKVLVFLLFFSGSKVIRVENIIMKMHSNSSIFKVFLDATNTYVRGYEYEMIFLLFCLQ